MSISIRVQDILYGLACAEAEPPRKIKTQDVAQHKYTGRSFGDGPKIKNPVSPKGKTGF